MISKSSKYFAYLLSIVSIVALLLFAFAAQSVVSSLWRNNEALERNYITERVENRLNSVESDLGYIAAFVEGQHHDDEFEQELEDFSEYVFSSTNGVVNFSVAPNGIQEIIFPLEGNEAIIGHDLLTDERSEVVRAVNDAINTKELQVNGPYQMRTNPNKSVMVYRYPVFEEDGTFYGLVNIVVETEQAIFPIGERYDSPIYNFDVQSKDGILIFGSVEEVLASDSITSELFNWTIDFEYKDSYLDSLDELTRILDIVFLSLLFFIIFLELYLVRRIGRMSEVIDEMIYYDKLTELPNRRLLESYLIKMEETSFTLCFMDVDDFKYINDTYGHDFGDKVLREIAQGVKKKESIEFYRWGGDEFAIILKTTNKKDIEEYLKTLYDSFKNSLLIEDVVVKIGFSIGVVINKDNTSIDKCVQYADMAMYAAKTSGKNTYVYYDDSHGFELAQLFKFDQMSRIMKFEENADVYFQPRFSFESSEIVGLEALFRVIDKDNAFLPSKFIEAAENNGTIQEIDRFCLRRVFTYMKRLKNHGLDIPVAVNVSGITLLNDYPKFLHEMMKEEGVSPDKVEIEITESVSLKQYENVTSILEELRGLGVNVYMDDFGKEYSGLANLNVMPIDGIKIDREFVSKLHREHTLEIVGSIIGLGHKMGLEVIAEGVETLEQYNTLKLLGCDSFQGFLYERPISIESLIEKYEK